MDSEIRRILLELNAGNGENSKKSWREISRMKQFQPISFATLSAYARGRPIINQLHREIFGLPKLVRVPENMVRKTAPRTTKRTYNRTTIYPTTPTDKILSELQRVTGKQFEVKG